MQWPWSKADSELDREVQHHLETLADAYERQGLSRQEAMRQARAEFGGVDKAKEECRDIRWWSWLTQVVQDLRFGWRMMRKTPAITVAAVASLALGIGATTSILSLADALLWRTLPVPRPEQLNEVLWQVKADPKGLVYGSSGSNYREGPLQVANYFSRDAFEAMRKFAAGKAQIAGYMGATQVSVSYGDDVFVGNLRGVTDEFFAMLAIQPFAGRLQTQDGEDATRLAAVVTHRFWKQRLGGRTDAVGELLRINNTPYFISGILPAGFQGITPGDDTDVYSAVENTPEFQQSDGWLRSEGADPRTWWMQILMRRTSGAAERDLVPVLDTAFASTWAALPESPEATPHIRLADASKGLGAVRGMFGNPVRILLGLTLMVLIVACANIANLLLARAVTREKEMALRVSLGCGRGRLARQLFTESLLLACAGGALSVPVTMLVGKVIVSLIGMELMLEPDLRTLAGTGALAFLTALLFSFYPVLRATKVDPSPALKQGTASAKMKGRQRWAPAKMLVLFQTALGVLLVSMAVLFTSHLREIVDRDAGFERAHLLLFDLRPGEVGYESDRLRQFYAEIEARLGALPGVESVALARTRPMRGGGFWDRVEAPGNADGAQAAIHHAGASFLQTLGVPILSGRDISDQEARTGAKVAVISEDLAAALKMDSPLGRAVSMSGREYEVVGVAKAARYSRMTESPAVAYVPFDYELRSATVILRTSTPPLAVLGSVREAVERINRDIPLVATYSMEQQISRTLQTERLFAWLCGSFGSLALVLCVVGLYGLLSHTTARRTPEMGIRRALGATRSNVVSQVLSEGMSLAGLGIAFGAPLALYGASVLESLKLLEPGGRAYGTLALAIGVVAFSALLAALAPARRAASVEPMEALRRG